VFSKVEAVTFSNKCNLLIASLQTAWMQMYHLHRLQLPHSNQDAWNVMIQVFVYLRVNFLSSHVQECFFGQASHPNQGGQNITLHAARRASQIWPLISGILFAGSKLWTTSRAKEFYEIIIFCKISLMPSHAKLLDIMELDAVAHHDCRKADMIIKILCVMYCEAMDSIHSYNLLNSIVDQSEKLINKFRIDICVEVAARAICSLHLYLFSFSPLTTAPLSPNAEWDMDDPQFEWLEKCWNRDDLKEEDINKLVSHQRTEAGNNDKASEKSTRLMLSLRFKLCGSPEFRMNELQSLYPKVS
jgi:hypothetical protein